MSVTKPRVYWRPVSADEDPDDACWAVQIGNCDIGIDGQWVDAFRYAYLNAALEGLL